MHVILSWNERDVVKLLEKYTFFDYIYYGEKDTTTCAMLTSSGSREICPQIIFNDLEKEKFIKEYLDLIGKLDVHYNSLSWYSTCVSSKNKFLSGLLPNLYLFLSIIRILKQREQTLLVLLNLPEEIIFSIEHYCTLNSITCSYNGGTSHTLCNTIHNFYTSIVSRLVFICGIWKEISIARFYFSSRVRQKINPATEYYVLRSWVYERSIINNEYRDSFFGCLPGFLSQRKNVLILAGIIGNYHTIVKKVAAEKNYLIIPQEFFLSFLDPLRTLIALRKNRITISEKLTCCGHDVTDIVRKEVERHFRTNVFDFYLYSYIMKHLTRSIKIDTFTTTYENNPWERVCFKTLKECSPETKIIGYQHAALSKSSLNMIRSDNEKGIIPMPDRIVTVGEITREFLINKGNYDPDTVRTGCGLRFSHLFTLEATERKRKNSILIAPEGVLSETVTLVNFVQSALKNCNMPRIVLRPHPALPYQNFKKYLTIDPVKTGDFYISSHDSIKKDLDEADIVIYRGSTVALEALKMGIPVIYVALSDIISVDPLFDCKDLRWIVRNEKELIDSITMIYGMTPSDYEIKCHASQEFIRHYIVEISKDRLQEFIL